MTWPGSTEDASGTSLVGAGNEREVAQRATSPFVVHGVERRSERALICQNLLGARTTPGEWFLRPLAGSLTRKCEGCGEDRCHAGEGNRRDDREVAAQSPLSHGRPPPRPLGNAACRSVAVIKPAYQLFLTIHARSTLPGAAISR